MRLLTQSVSEGRGYFGPISLWGYSPLSHIACAAVGGFDRGDKGIHPPEPRVYFTPLVARLPKRHR